MPLVTSQGMVQRFAMGLYGVQLGTVTMGQVMTDVNNAGGLPKINDIFNGYYSYSFASTSTTDVAKAIVANFGIAAGKNGLTAANVTAATDYVAGQLASVAASARGGKVAEILNLWSGLTADATFGAAATAWNTQTAYADVYGTRVAADMAVGSVVTTFNLTANNDSFTGSSGADMFMADYIANGNSLSSGDKITGGDGIDTLDASMTKSALAIEPTISGVEIIKFQAQESDTITGDNNVTNVADVLIDAGRISGMTTLENNNSRADLVVEDVRLDAGKITKDLTIVMRETDPGDVDYGVYFDQGSLRNVSASTSQINVRVLDTYAVAQGADPLRDSPYGSFTFSYKTGTGALTAVTLASQAMQDAKTFSALVTAMQAAADAKFGAGVVTVKLGTTYSVPDSVTNALVTGTEITLAATGSITFDTTVAGSGWLATETVPAISGLYTSFNTAVSSSTALVTSTIVLDDVGRGSTGGDLIIGGLSVGDTSTSRGVQRFEVTVEDNSKLQAIASTNNTLREVTIVNGTTTRATDAYTTTVANSGNLEVLGDNGVIGSVYGAAGAPAMPGSSALGDATSQDKLPGAAAQINAFGFNDVRLIDASAMTGKLAFDAQVTTASLNKYLNLTDTANNPADDNVAFAYSGGGNDDTISVVLDNAVVAARDQLTGREDFSFTVNGNSGNDAITVAIAGANTANWYQNHKSNKNLTIDAGAGNDTVKLPGTGAAIVLAGAGDDVVFTDNSGTIGATWVVNDTAVALLTDPLANANARGFMYDGKVTVSFTGSAASGPADATAANFDNGFEVVASIPTGANYVVTQLHINQAIKTAINSDPVLKTLLKAEDGPASTLKITSLIDGTFNANDLKISVTSADLTTLTATTQATVLTAYKAFTQDTGATIAAAQAANAATVVASNAGAGMDANQVLGATAGTSLNFAIAVTTQGSAAAGAVVGTNEVATFTVGALLANETVVINGLTITAGAAGATAGAVEALLEGGVAGVNGGATATGANNAAAYTIGAGAAGTVVYTSATLGNVANLNNTGTGAGTFAYVQGVNAAAATVNATEVFTVTVTGTASATGTETITFDGTPTAALAANANANAVAAAIALASVAGGAYGVGVANGNVVTFTNNTANTVIVDAVAADFATNIVPTISNGAASTAESDNTVNLGAGNDVAILGTGALSNDTVVFTGYDIGKNTVVNFEDVVVASRDSLDFNAYLTGKKVVGTVTSDIAVTLNANIADVSADAVRVLTAPVFTSTDTFAGLTAAKLLAAVNSTNVANAANYAGITAATLDALNTYTTSTLIGGIGKAVVMVENSGNKGEFAMFELTFNGLATNTTKDFTSAVLIGTVDFGTAVDFTNVLVA